MINGYKFGVLNLKNGQKLENECYSNGNLFKFASINFQINNEIQLKFHQSLTNFCNPLERKSSYLLYWEVTQLGSIQSVCTSIDFSSFFLLI